MLVKTGKTPVGCIGVVDKLVSFDEEIVEGGYF